MQPLLQTLEDMLQHAVEDVQHFMIMVVKLHLQVQTRELGQMAMRIRVLGTENRPDFKHALHIPRDAHLLRELRALREERGPPEVVYLEYCSAGLSPTFLELGRLNLEESLGCEVFAEQRADGATDAEYRLVDGGLE